MPFLDLFPKVPYDVNRGLYSDYEMMTNVLFRVAFIKKVLNNIAAYSYYTIRDGDTPEIIAENVYNDPEAHWMILLANDIVDPQFDWPMEYDIFNKYVKEKYGSIANAKTTIHHYEKVIQREESLTGIITETRFVVDYDTLTDSVLTIGSANGDFSVGNTAWIGNTFTGNVQVWSNSNGYLQLSNTTGSVDLYSTITSNTANGIVTDILYPQAPYEYFLSLPDTQGIETINFGNGKTVIETTSREAITNYDWEMAENERKREIKIIKPVYYQQIISEFDNLTKNSRNPFLRTLR